MSLQRRAGNGKVSNNPVAALFSAVVILGMLSLVGTTPAFAAEAPDLRELLRSQEQTLIDSESRLGFNNPELIPFLRDLVTTHIALGDFQPVSNYLQRIRNLSASEGDRETLFGAIQAQAQWHLTEGVPNRLVSNYFIARELTDDVVDNAERLFGDNYSDFLPWLYSSALNQHRLFGLLNGEREVRWPAELESRIRDGLNSGELPIVRELPRFPDFGKFGLADSVMGRYSNPRIRSSRPGERYLQQAAFLTGAISAILEESGDLEARAMALISQADFQMFLDSEAALYGYLLAHQLLLAAEVPAHRIRLYFGRPQALPVDRLFFSLEEAIAHQEVGLASWRPQQENERHVAPFMAWSEYAATSPMPVSDHAYWDRDTTYSEVDLRFQINRNGTVSGARVLGAEPNESRMRRIARQATRALQFRPAIIAGEFRRWGSVHMRFMIPQTSDDRS